MALSRVTKEAIVTEVTAVASQAISAVVALNHGLSAGEMTELRVNARKQQVFIKVVPNNLLKLAVAGSEFECLQECLIGPTIIAFSKNEPGAAGRLIRDFAKTHPKMGVKAVAIGGKAYDAQQLDMLASLPSFDEAVASLMSVMLAPVGKLVRTMPETYTKVVRAVAAVRDLKAAA